MTNGNYLRALQSASRSMIEAGYEQERQLEPSEFDGHFSINSPWWPHCVIDGPDVSMYVDTVDEQGGRVDYAALQEYVFTRRQVAFKKNGIIYDPIDDAGFSPEPHRSDLWYMMRADQIEGHIDEILSSGADIETLAKYVSEDFYKDNADKLRIAGVRKRQPERQKITTRVAEKIAGLFSEHRRKN